MFRHRQFLLCNQFKLGVLLATAVTLILLITWQATAVAARLQEPPETKPVTTIDAFTFTAEDVSGTGKLIRFQWQTTNVTEARIISGASQYNARWWNVEPNGELEITLPRTLFHDPEMILLVTDGTGQYATQSVTIPWDCEFPYFFQPPPAGCALQAHTVSRAVAQRFEHGRLIWIERIALREEFRENRIYAFYETGPAQNNWERFDNIASADVHLPDGCDTAVQGGFSRVWQENEAVRLKLGCPQQPESPFDTFWQWQLNEAGTAVAYLRTSDNRVIQLYGEQKGGWLYQRP